MVSDEIKVWLYDIRKAIDEIDGFFSDKPMLFKEYQKDIRTKRAVERNIEIIGEATNRILKKDREISFTDSAKIIGTRNRIIHGYDSVSDELIWAIVINHLPLLKKEIIAFLEE